MDDDDSHIEPLAMASSSSGDGQHVELETLKKSSREMRDALQQMRTIQPRSVCLSPLSARLLG